MSNKPKLCLTSCVLASLMYDNSNSSGDQEGFFIGRVKKYIRREISDQSMCNTQEELVISIYSSVPCGNFLSFYGGSGDVNESEVESLLGERKSDVVGWYRYRRHSPIHPTLRESAVHRNLRTIFPDNDFFIYGILSAGCVQNVATHSFDYAFYLLTLNNIFRPLSISLLNLGDAKSQYRTFSVASTYLKSSSFDAVLGSTWKFESCWQTEDMIQNFHASLREKLDNCLEELSASDAINHTLENDIDALNAEIEQLMLLKATSSIDSAPAASSENVAAQETESEPPAEESSSCAKRSTDGVVASQNKRFCFGKYFTGEKILDEDHETSEHESATLTPRQKKVKIIYLSKRKHMSDVDDTSSSETDKQSESATSFQPEEASLLLEVSKDEMKPVESQHKRSRSEETPGEDESN